MCQSGLKNLFKLGEFHLSLTILKYAAIHITSKAAYRYYIVGISSWYQLYYLPINLDECQLLYIEKLIQNYPILSSQLKL